MCTGWKESTKSLRITATKKWHRFSFCPKPAVECSNWHTGADSNEILSIYSRSLLVVNIFVFIYEFGQLPLPWSDIHMFCPCRFTPGMQTAGGLDLGSI